jgi:di- and tripeptidase
VNSLRDFVAFRTVASNPRYVRDCHEAVTFLRKRCSAFGANTSLLSTYEGVNPILLAKFPASKPSGSTRSILFYGHYDVVDAEYDLANPNPTWHGDPFVLQPLSSFLYGRGVTDNKGPILAAIYAVADLVQTGSLSCNVTFLLEGDEEAGSRGFRQTVQSAHDAIGPVDFILLSNSYWLDDHIPCLTFGMRGVIHASVTISSNRPDLHSGMDGKSVQHEPLKDLTVLLAALVGPSGTKVTIPEFYDSVDELSESEVKSYASITSSLLPGHPEIKNEKSFALSLMQRWRHPNLTVHRIEVPEAKTAVTISGSAKATLSIRIVPSQTAEQIAQSLTQHLRDEFAKLQSSNTLTVAITSKADPWLADVRNEIYEALKNAIVDIWNPDVAVQQHRAFKIAADIRPEPKPSSRPASSTSQSSSRSPTSNKNPFYPNSVSSSTPTRPAHRRASSLAATGSFPPSALPREPLFIREGGSIPAISFLEHEFNAPAAMFPMGQASDNAHLDNERMRVENLYKGREVLRRVFARL